MGSRPCAREPTDGPPGEGRPGPTPLVVASNPDRRAALPGRRAHPGRPGHTELVAMPECDGCGSHVSTRFVRVFASNDGVVEGCPQCMSNADLFEGGTVVADATSESLH